MKSLTHFAQRRGFTLIELMVVVALVAIILVLAAPSFKDMLVMRRLRGASAELVTDVQFARSEAVSRQQGVVLRFERAGPTGPQTCYSIAACRDPAWVGCTCDCYQGAGNSCAAAVNATEIRTVKIAIETGVRVDPFTISPAPATSGLEMRFDPVIAGMKPIYIGVGNADYAPVDDVSGQVSVVEDGRTLRTLVSLAGRPSVCSPGGRVVGVPACP